MYYMSINSKDSFSSFVLWMFGTSSPVVSVVVSLATAQNQKGGKTFAICNIKTKLLSWLAWPEKISHWSVFIPSFRHFVDCNLGTKGLAVKQ